MHLLSSNHKRTFNLMALRIGLLCFSVGGTIVVAQAETPNAFEDIDTKHAQELWDDLHKELQGLGERVAQQDKLPKASLLHPFRNNKKRNKKKIDKLTIRLMESLGASPLDTVLKRRIKLIAKHQKLIGKIAKLEESKIGAPEKAGMFGTSKSDIDKKIQAKQDEIRALGEEHQKLLGEVRQTFKSMGLTLTHQQVQDLFGIISGDTMRGFFVQFSNLRLLSETIDYLLKKNSGAGYSKLAKRYYAVYVALIHMLINAHEVTLERMRQIHIPKVRELMQQSEAQMKKTEALMRDPKHSANHQIYEQNLKVQRQLARAAKSYEGYLFEQAKKIGEARDALKLRFSAVLNTYQTVTLSTGLISAIRSGVKDISELQNLGLPQLLPLSDEKLQGEFQLVTRELSGDTLDAWKRR